MNTNTVEIELTTSTLAAITREAERTGRTVDEVIVEKLAHCIARTENEDITVPLRFSQTEWRRLEHKAKLADCSALAMLTSTRDLLVDTEELVPCWLPQAIYNRLWQAAEAVELDADEIAETVLGELIEDLAAFADIVCTGWKLSGEKTAALGAVLAGWATEETPSQLPR